METRFGFIAINKGFITLKQLTQAITIQVYEEINKNQRRIVGTILVEMGAMTPEQRDEVVAELKRWQRNRR